MSPPLLLLGGSWPEEPGLDVAISRLILSLVSKGDLPTTMRLFVPGREVAFGKRDTVTPQYPAAVTQARAAGFGAVERLAGGRAAVFTEGTIAFALAVPDPDPHSTVHDRFRLMSSIVVEAFGKLGISAAIGQLPGEYCPGEYSVHHANRIKLMGIGQRLERKAAHVGGVIAVDRTDLLLRALVPVYRALELEWRPATAGSLSDVSPGMDTASVLAALRRVLAKHYTISKDRIDDKMVRLARNLTGDFLPG